MILLANLMIGIAAVLHSVYYFFFYIIIIQALISWVNPDPYNFFVRFLYSATEPVYRLIRRYLPWTRYGMMDFSPLVALFLLMFIDRALVTTLEDYGRFLKLGPL